MNNTRNLPSKFITKNWVEMNDNSHRTCNTNRQIKLKTSMLKSSLCDYSGAHIHVTQNITVVGMRVTKADQRRNRNNKQAVIKNCAPTDDITEINSTQVDNTKYLDVVMLMYKLIEYIIVLQKHSAVYINFAEISQIIT